MGRRASTWGMMGMVLALEVGLGVLAAVITVWGPLAGPEPLPDIRVAPPLVSRKLEMETAVAAFAEAAGPPVMRDLLTTESLLPDLPTVAPGPPPDQAAAAEAVFSDTTAMFGDGWAAAVPGMEGDGERVSLLGLEDRAERLVVLFDVSASVVRKAQSAGVPMTRIRDEAARLVEGLSPSALFGLVQFSRAYESFRPGLVPGTRANRQAAREWLETRFVTDGRSRRDWVRGRPDGILSVLEEAFRLEPDVIFILSDMSFEFTPEGGGDAAVPWTEIHARAKAWRAASGRQPRVHLIAFQARPEHLEGARQFARAMDGQLQER